LLGATPIASAQRLAAGSTQRTLRLTVAGFVLLMWLQAQRQRREIEQPEQAAQIAALQEQVTENAKLKARIEALEQLVKATQTAWSGPTE